MAVEYTQNLASLPMGKKGLVMSMEIGGLNRRRLLDMGLVPGTVVEAIRRSPGGDPTAFSIRGAVVALRAEEGCRIMVQPV